MLLGSADSHPCPIWLASFGLVLTSLFMVFLVLTNFLCLFWWSLFWSCLFWQVYLWSFLFWQVYFLVCFGRLFLVLLVLTSLFMVFLVLTSLFLVMHVLTSLFFIVLVQKIVFWYLNSPFDFILYPWHWIGWWFCLHWQRAKSRRSRCWQNWRKQWTNSGKNCVSWSATSPRRQSTVKQWVCDWAALETCSFVGLLMLSAISIFLWEHAVSRMVAM